MYEKLEKQVHEFYNNQYLRNRYPSLSYIPSDFVESCPDVAAVALGYKPAAWLGKPSKTDLHFITGCCYRGKELFYLDECNVLICDRKDFEKFKEIWGTPNSDKEWGTLLGYPEHLVNLFCECSEGREFPDWEKYNLKAEHIALKMCMDID